MQPTLRAAVTVLLVLAFITTAVLAGSVAKEDAHLPVSVEVVDTGPEYPTQHHGNRIFSVTVRVTNHGEKDYTMTAWTWARYRKGWAYWPSNATGDGQFSLQPGETRVLELQATHPDNSVAPGMKIQLVIMTVDGDKRTGISPTMPGTPPWQRTDTPTPPVNRGAP